MARHFVDTSALVKLYRNEPQTAAVQSCIGSNDSLVLCGITFLEFQSAFFGLVRQGLLSQGTAQQRISLLRQDLRNFTLAPLTQMLVTSAEALIQQFGVSEGLRPADSLQLAAALDMHGQQPLDSIISTDVILRRCSTASGLIVKP